MTMQIINGNCLDVLRTLPEGSVQCCVTSPSYWGLRDYGLAPVDWPTGWRGCHGLEPTLEMYVQHAVLIFREVRRVLRGDGTLWLNLGDAYSDGTRSSASFRRDRSDVVPRMENGSGLPPKNLLGIPWRVAFALQADGWWLRQDIIWSKPNPMPESVKDRCCKSHEYLFLLSKSQRYYFDAEAIKEPVSPGTNPRKARNGMPYRDGWASDAGPHTVAVPSKRNKRSVWIIPTQACSDAHFATFPEALVKPCILAGCPVGGTVLDPFLGSGTVGRVATELGRECIGIELNPEYVEIARGRCNVTPGLTL